MPERGFDSGFWSDRWVRRISSSGRYLFLYLWSNDHCNQAGTYEITLDTIASETGLPQEDLPALLEEISEKVKWVPELDIVWVKNFVKHQAKSPKFLIAAAKSLAKLGTNGLIKEVVEYNQAHGVSIPYQYPKDSVSIPPVSDSVSSSKSVSEEEEEVEGKEKRTTTDSTLALGELQNVSLTPEEHGKLVERFGAQGATRWIEELSLAKASKGYKTKSDYATILAWERRESDPKKGGRYGADRQSVSQDQPANNRTARLKASVGRHT